MSDKGDSTLDAVSTCVGARKPQVQPGLRRCGGVEAPESFSGGGDSWESCRVPANTRSPATSADEQGVHVHVGEGTPSLTPWFLARSPLAVMREANVLVGQRLHRLVKLVVVENTCSHVLVLTSLRQPTVHC